MASNCHFSMEGGLLVFFLEFFPLFQWSCGLMQLNHFWNGILCNKCMMANETLLHTVLVLVTNAMARPQTPHAQHIMRQTSATRVEQQHWWSNTENKGWRKKQNIVKKTVKGIFLLSFHQDYRQYECLVIKEFFRESRENFLLKVY